MLQHPALISLYLAVFLSLPSFSSVSLKKERTWDQREPQTAQEVERKEGIRKLLKLLWGHDTRQKAALEKFQTIAPLFYPANTLQPGKYLSQAQTHASSVEDAVKSGWERCCISPLGCSWQLCSIYVA